MTNFCFYCKGIYLTVVSMMLVSWMPVRGQDASVELTVNATQVKQQDLIRLTVTFVNCKVKQIDPPQIQGLDWRMGPSTSSNTQWVNGVTSSKQQFTYGYAVTAEQKVDIPVINWQTNRGTLKSNAVEILVESGINKNVPRRSKTKSVARDLVTAIEPSKRTVYLGESLVLTYKIYNRYTNLDVRNYDIPELEGFWKETVQTAEARWEPQLINGKRYNVATVRQIVAFPQQTGTFTLQGFNLTGYLRINFFEGRDIQATCDAVEIEVLPLPEVSPANSTGTFSDLKVTQTLSADTVDVNEAFNLEVKFKGSGNLKFLREPELVWPQEFEVFEAEVTDKISVTSRGELGSRAFKFVVIPRAPGDYNLPAYEAIHFDPLTGRHVTSLTEALNVHVRKNPSSEGTSMTFAHQQDVQVLTQDVRHILTSPSRFIPRSRPPWTTWAFAFGMLTAPATFAFAAIRRRRHNLAKTDVLGTRKRHAFRILQATLQKDLTIETVGEAMEQYLMAKLGWERSQLTRDAVKIHLSHEDMSLAESWDKFWMACEMQRYGASQGNIDSLAKQLIALAETTESNLS